MASLCYIFMYIWYRYNSCRGSRRMTMWNHNFLPRCNFFGKNQDLWRVIPSVDTCFFLWICFCTVLLHLVIHNYISIFQKQRFLLLPCCITFLFKTNTVNKRTNICKSCVFVVSRGHPRLCSHTPAHTLHMHQRRVCDPPAWNPAPCIEQNHFLLVSPCPPFHLKGLWSRRGWVDGGHAFRCCASGQQQQS